MNTDPFSSFDAEALAESAEPISVPEPVQQPAPVLTASSDSAKKALKAPVELTETTLHSQLASLDERCEGEKVDFTRDIEWAYSMMNRKRGTVSPLDAPSPGAFNQLEVAWEMGPGNFIVNVVNKVVLSAEKKKNKNVRADDRETQFERLEKLRESLGLPESSEIPNIDIETRKHGGR